MKSSELQIKVASLAAEATIIRRLERKRLKAARWMLKQKKNANDQYVYLMDDYFRLQRHRVLDVRREARAAQLASAYLQGHPYLRIETLPKSEKKMPDRRHVLRAVVSHRVTDLVIKYGRIDGSADRPKHVPIQEWDKQRKARVRDAICHWMGVP